MNMRRIYAKRRREKYYDCNDRSGHKTMIQAEGVDDIAPNDKYLVGLSENSVSFGFLLGCIEDKL